MQDNLQIQKDSGVKPASFSALKREDVSRFQTELILRLLKSSIENNKPITLEDIKDIHAEYAMESRRHGSGYNWFGENGQKVWRRANTKEEWKNSHCRSSLSITWFKNNLGAAILKGKILAIPVIEL
jgi:hypothetical protein